MPSLTDTADTAVGTATDLFVHHGLPWMGKKAVEMGRYYGFEALRNKKLQKKAIDYALDKLSPMIQNVGSQALDQLSTKIRPKKNYITNRKDLDGGAIDIHKQIGKLPKPAGGWTLPVYMDSHIRKLDTRISNKESEVNALYTKIQKLEEGSATLYHKKLISKKLETTEMSLTRRRRKRKLPASPKTSPKRGVNKMRQL